MVLLRLTLIGGWNVKEREKKNDDWWKWNVVWPVFNSCWNDFCWNYVYWWKMLIEVLIEMLFEMLIEMLIDDLMKFVRTAFDAEAVECTNEFSVMSGRLHLTMKRSDALTSLRWCQKGCTLMIECIGGFSILSKNCIWFWNNQVHWRIFDFVRELHLNWSDQMHWRIFDIVRKTVSDSETIKHIDGFSIFDTDRSTGGRAEPQTDKQNKTSNETMFADC